MSSKYPYEGANLVLTARTRPLKLRKFCHGQGFELNRCGRGEWLIIFPSLPSDDDFDQIIDYLGELGYKHTKSYNFPEGFTIKISLNKQK